MRNELRDAAIVEVKSRIVEACLKQAQLRAGLPLDVLINDTLYHEKKRLETDRQSPTRGQDLAFWEGIRARLGKAGEGELKALLVAIVDRFAEEVRGNFSPWVYGMATKFVPRALPVLLNAMSPKRLMSRGMPSIAETIAIRGDVERLRRANELGTVILAPTHLSNMDSPVIGYALFAMGLPPFTYGAGLNLFANPLLSFFMRNLGAYRVDRRKTAPLYKDILKEYATVSLELGQPNLFFPGGTRARSGEVEQRLKLGLLSSGLRAYINNLQRKKERPNIYVVTCTINYHLVLEAESLITDYLKQEGKSRYIITDDESSRPRKILQFTQNLVNLDSRITVNVGDVLDPFGNHVDDAGESVDGHGRRVDITRYVVDKGDRPVHLPQRDRVFTRQCGDAIGASFKRHNEILSTHVAAFTLFETIRGRHPELDLYRLIRTGDEGTGIPVRDLVRNVAFTLAALRQRDAEGQITLDRDTVAQGDAAATVQAALRHFGTYHARPVMVRRGDRVFTEDMTVLYYYSNRLRGYGVERDLSEALREAA